MRGDLKVYTWNYWEELDGLAHPLVWLEYRCRPGHPFTFLPSSDPKYTRTWSTPDPYHEGERVAELLLCQPKGHRVLFLWHAGSDMYDIAKTPDGLLQMLVTEPETSQYRAWLNIACEQIKKAGVNVDFLVIDHEIGFGWTPTLDDPKDKLAFLNEVLSIPNITDRYNGALKDFDPENWVKWGQWHGKGVEDTYRLWHFSRHIKIDALTKSMAKPIWFHFGRHIPVSQYGCYTPAWTIRELNNHPIRPYQTYVADFVNTPSCYIWPGNYANVQARKVPEYCRASYSIGLETDRVIKMINGSAAFRTTVPWLSDPLWNERGFSPEVVTVGWVQVFRSAVNANCDTLLLFNVSKDDIRNTSAEILKEEIEKANKFRQSDLFQTATENPEVIPTSRYMSAIS